MNNTKLFQIVTFVILYCYVVVKFGIMNQNIYNHLNTNNNETQPPIQYAQTQEQAINTITNAFSSPPSTLTNPFTPRPNNNNRFRSQIGRITGVDIFDNLNPPSRNPMTPHTPRLFQSTNNFAKHKHKQHRIMNSKSNQYKKRNRQNRLQKHIKFENDNNEQSNPNNIIHIEGVSNIYTDGVIFIDCDASDVDDDIVLNANNGVTDIGEPPISTNINDNIITQQYPSYTILPISTDTQTHTQLLTQDSNTETLIQQFICDDTTIDRSTHDENDAKQEMLGATGEEIASRPLINSHFDFDIPASGAEVGLDGSGGLIGS
eukprot:195805_1